METVTTYCSKCGREVTYMSSQPAPKKYICLKCKSKGAAA